jgi:signal transduction histidine kinase
MELRIAANDDTLHEVASTDPQAVEQILFNLVDNACKYAQSSTDRTIHVSATHSPQWIVLRVRDHGPGISKTFARRLFQPFSKSVEDAAVSAPGVGLGLALCRRLASEIGGSLELEAGEGHDGATFRLTLPRAT